MTLPVASARACCVASVLLAVACGPLQRGAPADEGVLIFENASMNQAAVYAGTSPSDMIRLGTVFPGRTDTLRVPSSVTGRGTAVNIVARMLSANSSPQTGPVSFGPRDAYHVRLTNNSSILTITPADMDDDP